MSEVFLSYRQTDDAQKQRVRAFGDRLRDAGINVVLDQFFEDGKPAGPKEAGRNGAATERRGRNSSSSLVQKRGFSVSMELSSREMVWAPPAKHASFVSAFTMLAV